MSTVRVSKPSHNPKTPGSGLHTFRCAGCYRRHHIGVYVVAQCAMGHTLTHTCDCGQKHTVEEAGRSYKVRAASQPPGAATPKGGE